ncbi:zinc metallopeptidase [Candidatus Sumerlaeota bacterium]|nr:zinc metallopeptidase [Candidatus Sumerlaeota bacterium]
MFAYIGMFVVMLLAMWAQHRVKGNFAKYSQVRASSGLTGAQAAARMLKAQGVTNVAIERSQGGGLSDHYDPRANVIRLSSGVFDSTSVAALGVACHEAGHAMQKAQNYAPLVIRNAAVPAAGFLPNVGMVMLMIGLIMGVGVNIPTIGFYIAAIGLGLFSISAILQVINLPVEFDATARAKRALVETGIIQRGDETRAVDKVLDAAALTYVAATLGAIMSVLYYAALIFGGRRRD